jgi:nonribosomal peptide synthetase protein BlmVI
MLETGGRKRPAIVAEVRAGTDDLDAVCAAIRDRLRDRLGIELAAITLIERGTIPRTTSGKTKRNACRELFLRGQLAAVAEWLDVE